MSFFSSFWGSCRGTEVFDELRRNSFLKALFHLLILVILCGSITGAGGYFLSRNYWKRTENSFTEQFGAHLYNVTGTWQPSIAPRNSRHLQLSGNTLILYASLDGAESLSDIPLANQNNIILWAPGCFGVAVRSGGDQWFYMSFLPGGQINAVPEQLSAAGLQRQLANSVALPAGKWPHDETTVSCKEIFGFLRFCHSFVQGVGFALNSLVMIVLDTLCFSVVFRLFSNRHQVWFTFGELFSIGIYAAFPVLAAVTAFPALQLPLIEHLQTFFMIGWIIYLLIILHSLRNRPEGTPENGETHDPRQ